MLCPMSFQDSLSTHREGIEGTPLGVHWVPYPCHILGNQWQSEADHSNANNRDVPCSFFVHESRRLAAERLGDIPLPDAVVLPSLALSLS